jgi:hypothetical protein
MVTPKAASHGTEAGIAVSMPDEGNNLLEEVLLKAEMAGEPGSRNDGAVVPAFGVNRINTKELQVSGFQLVLNGVDHAPILEVEKASTGGRKSECRKAGVAKDEELHLPPEGWR